MDAKVFVLEPLGDDTMRNAMRDMTTDDAYLEKLVYTAQGNPGAMTVIRAIHDIDIERAAFCLGKCMAWNIIGPMLWLLYKDVCKQDPEQTLKLIELETAPDELEKLSYANYKRP